MYIPRYTRITDTQTITQFIQGNPFGILVSANSGLPIGTHLPFLVEQSAEPGAVLTTHVARSNPHADLFANSPLRASETADDSAPLSERDLSRRDLSPNALVIFHGPHTYVSSSWYEQNDGIPTWNYTAAHVYGHARTIHDTSKNVDILKSTIARFDPALLTMWENPEHLDYFRKMSRGIVGIEIVITSVEAKFKLSQNRSDADFRRVIDMLERERTDEQSHLVARMMQALKKGDSD